MSKRLALLAAVLLALCLTAWAGGKSWTGTVSDSHCGTKHAEASDAAAGCVESCVKGGAKYVLVADGKVYQLEPQDKFKGKGGKTIKVTGEMKDMTITAASVE